MPKLSVYYIEHEDNLAPRFFCIWFGKGAIAWDKPYIYIPVDAPFQRKHSEDFDDDVLSLSIAQTELTIHPDQQGEFGILMSAVQKRLNKMRSDTMPFAKGDIEQFIIQIGDIEEVLQMDVTSIYNWQ